MAQPAQMLSGLPEGEYSVIDNSAAGNGGVAGGIGYDTTAPGSIAPKICKRKILDDGICPAQQESVMTAEERMSAIATLLGVARLLWEAGKHAQFDVVILKIMVLAEGL